MFPNARLTKAAHGAWPLALFYLTLFAGTRAAQNITIDDTDSRIQYSSDSVGRWVHQTSAANAEPYLSACVGGSLSATNTTGTATFTFSGTAVYVQALMNINGDSMSISLDNDTYGPFDIFSSTINVSSIIFTMDKLDQNAPHTLVVQKYNASSPQYANLDAIIYTIANSTSPSPPPQSPTPAPGSHPAAHDGISTGAIIAIAIGGAAIAAGVVFWCWWRRRLRPNARPSSERGESKWTVDYDYTPSSSASLVTAAAHPARPAAYPSPATRRGTVVLSYAPSAPSSSAHSPVDPVGAMYPPLWEAGRVPSVAGSSSATEPSSIEHPRRRNTLGTDISAQVVLHERVDDTPPRYEP